TVPLFDFPSSAVCAHRDPSAWLLTLAPSSHAHWDYGCTAFGDRPLVVVDEDNRKGRALNLTHDVGVYRNFGHVHTLTLKRANPAQIVQALVIIIQPP